MIHKMTHSEACELVEGPIERCGKTLAYIRLRLEEDKKKRDLDCGEEERLRHEVMHAEWLCNLRYSGSYIQGARRMLAALQEWNLLDIPAEKTGRGKYSDTVRHYPKQVNEAIIKLIQSDLRNLEWFLWGLPANVELFVEKVEVPVRKGKKEGYRASFRRKVTEYKEI